MWSDVSHLLIVVCLLRCINNCKPGEIWHNYDDTCVHVHYDLYVENKLLGHWLETACQMY